MIDNFALGLIHLLLGIAVWKLLTRPDLDRDRDPDESQGSGMRPGASPRTPRRDRR